MLRIRHDYAEQLNHVSVLNRSHKHDNFIRFAYTLAYKGHMTEKNKIK